MFCLLTPGILHAPANTAHASHHDLDLPAIREYVRERMTTESIPSIAIAVVHGKEIVWEEGFGWADRENHLVATPHTPFYLASVTKALTGTAVMRLAESHQIDLDHPINEYLGLAKVHSPKWDAAGATVRGVATHTAGLTTYNRKCALYDAHCRISPANAIRRHGVLFWPPGEHFDYSNLGYGILGEMVSHISGRSYADFLHDAGFVPLGMKDCLLGTNRTLSPVAAQYDSGSHTRTPIEQSDTPAASSMLCSVHDLALFGMFAVSARYPGQKPLLSDASLKMMLNPTVETGDGERYGFGWSLQPDLHGYQGVFAQGGTNDSFAVLQTIPSEGIAVAVIANTGTTVPFEIVDRVLGDMLSRYRENLARQQSVATLPATIAPRPISQAMAGVWIGTIKTWKGKVPLTLTISPDSQVYVAFGGGPRMAARAVDIQEPHLYCVVRGNVRTPDAPRPPYDIEIELYVRDKSLGGAATTQGGVQLPYWVQLQKSLVNAGN